MQYAVYRVSVYLVYACVCEGSEGGICCWLSIDQFFFRSGENSNITKSQMRTPGTVHVYPVYIEKIN